MVVYFGLALDEHFEQDLSPADNWAHYLGPSGLMQLLETACGLDHGAPDMDYLRIPLYRKAIVKLSGEQPHLFFSRSFASDQFATSRDLLQKRDELILSGWDFRREPEMPTYLAVFADLEKIIASDETILELISQGFADRFSRLLAAIPHTELPFQTLVHVEPAELLPIYWQRLFAVLAAKGLKIEAQEHKSEKGNRDLQTIQEILREKSTRKINLEGDGSFLILKSKRAVDLARQLAKIVSENPEFKPTCLLMDHSLLFDMVLSEEGQAALGLSQPSLSRPGQQVLKLAGSFLWHPVDPAKILEFTGLAVKPLQADLAYAIARYISERPGLMGEGWNSIVFGALARLEQRSRELADEAKAQYRFWFERKRYDIQRDAPKSEAISIFRYIQFWAVKQAGKESAPIYGQLAEQSRKAAELLDAIPEERVTALDIERVVRTIFEPLNTQLHSPQTGHLNYVRQPNALLSNPQQLLWWNFTATEKPYFFTHWTGEVIKYLASKGVSLDLPARKNKFQSWSQLLPLLKAGKQLILAIPESIDGKATNTHPLWPLIHTRISNPSAVSFDLDDPEQLRSLQKHLLVPEFEDILPREPENERLFLKLDDMPSNWQREYESPSSLESMIYYPYQWFFKYVLQWYKSPLLGMVEINTLKGKLAHKVLENMLQQMKPDMKREALLAWVDQTLQDLMEKEGSPLLLYGKEPEKLNFINKVQYAAWHLYSLIRENNWKPLAIEEDLDAAWRNIRLKARADLVLQRGTEERLVMDFKWRGKTYRRSQMLNKEDLQLCLYAWMYRKDLQWPATSWFIMEPSLVITRNPNIFNGIEALPNTATEAELYPELMQNIEATWDWRMGQFKQGLIELRTEANAALLEEHYSEDLSGLLEMKTTDASFDDYQVLVGKFQ